MKRLVLMSAVVAGLAIASGANAFGPRGGGFGPRGEDGPPPMAEDASDGGQRGGMRGRGGRGGRGGGGHVLRQLVFPCQSACGRTGRECGEAANDSTVACINDACPSQVSAAQAACAGSDRSGCRTAIDELRTCAEECTTAASTAHEECRATVESCVEACAAE